MKICHHYPDFVRTIENYFHCHENGHHHPDFAAATTIEIYRHYPDFFIVTTENIIQPPFRPNLLVR